MITAQEFIEICSKANLRLTAAELAEGLRVDGGSGAMSCREGREAGEQDVSHRNGKDMPPEPAPDGSENRNDSSAGEGWSSSDC